MINYKLRTSKNMKFVSMVTNLVDTHVNIMRFQYSVPIDLIVSLGYFRRTEENIS